MKPKTHPWMRAAAKEYSELSSDPNWRAYTYHELLEIIARRYWASMESNMKIVTGKCRMKLK